MPTKRYLVPIIMDINGFCSRASRSGHLSHRTRAESPSRMQTYTVQPHKTSLSKWMFLFHRLFPLLRFASFARARNAFEEVMVVFFAAQHSDGIRHTTGAGILFERNETNKKNDFSNRANEERARKKRRKKSSANGQNGRWMIFSSIGGPFRRGKQTESAIHSMFTWENDALVRDFALRGPPFPSSRSPVLIPHYILSLGRHLFHFIYSISSASEWVARACT